MVNLNHSGTRFALTVLFETIFFQVCIAAGIAISAASPNGPVALAVGPLVGVVWVLFAGYFVNITNIPIFLRWLTWISPVRYLFESLVWLQFDGQIFTCEKLQELPNGMCPISDGSQVIANLEFQDANLWLNAFVLLGMLFAFHALGCLFLRLRDPTGKK
jgi:hypothetical protein